MSRILVIDDEKYLRENIAEILEYGGYRVFRAEDGTAGIEMAREHMPDLIICDIMMPGLSGYDVLQELQGDSSTVGIPFLFLTANADRASMRQAMQLGADDYLTKPFLPDDLFAAVQARIEKRSRMTRQFENQFNELRGSLIAVLPHELRTPLNIIMGYADLLLEDYDLLTKDQLARMVRAISRSGHRLQHVIENYLLYAQTEIQQYDQFAIEAFSKQKIEDPDILVREIAHRTARTFTRENDLTIRTAAAVVRVSGDVLKKIVEEIVDNAFKFSPSGTTVDMTAETQGDYYSIQVSDQGRGMTAEQVSRIGAYMQFERKLYEQQGLGLGLILARRLTELSGGDLTVVSELQHGTTVHVRLPLSA